MTPLRIDIAVCTFRREALSDTLASLARLAVPEGVTITSPFSLRTLTLPPESAIKP